jgi:hypothetical protein
MLSPTQATLVTAGASAAETKASDARQEAKRERIRRMELVWGEEAIRGGGVDWKIKGWNQQGQGQGQGKE